MVVGDLGSRLEIFKMASNSSDESSSEECGVHAAGPPKKKKKSYKCKFKKDWVKKWPFISAVSQDVYSFRCNMCATNFSCAHQGERDVTRHISRESHKRNVASLSSQKKVTETFLSSSNPLVDKVSRAEVKVAAMLVQNNIPLSLADELTPLFQDIFPDSEIATKFSSRRTKTACVINGAIAPHFKENLVETMKEYPFSVSVDGSSDTGVEKMNPMTIRIFDINRGSVTAQFLDMCMSSSSTAQGIFTRMNEVLQNNGITWKTCVGLGVDNTSVNMGCRNSIKTRIQEKNEAIYIMGCPCHIVHNTAGKAGDAFYKATGFNVDDMVVDLFYWFDKSTKRKASLQRYCDFCDTTYREIVKHVNTRWLSLERAVGRVLQQYSALKSYFQSEEDSNPRFQRLQKLFVDPMTEVYLFFYHAALQTFVHFNQFLQREDPIISLVAQQIQSFLLKLVGKFLSAVVIRAAKSDLPTIGYADASNQLSDGEIFIGMATRMCLNKLQEEGDVSQEQCNRFFKGVRAFYVKSVEYALKNLPVADAVLANAKFINVMSRTEATLSQVNYFVRRYNDLLPFSSPQEHDKLSEEFTDYQLLNDNEVPESVWKSVVVQDDESCTFYRMDMIWHYLSNLKAVDGKNRFSRISHVAKLVLVIPHSNAEEERIFSMVRKNKTAFRPNLDPKGTLSSILTIKLGSHQPAHVFEPPKSMLKKAKTATWDYNKLHAKK